MSSFKFLTFVGSVATLVAACTLVFGLICLRNFNRVAMKGICAFILRSKSTLADSCSQPSNGSLRSRTSTTSTTPRRDFPRSTWPVPPSSRSRFPVLSLPSHPRRPSSPRPRTSTTSPLLAAPPRSRLATWSPAKTSPLLRTPLAALLPRRAERSSSVKVPGAASPLLPTLQSTPPSPSQSPSTTPPRTRPTRLLRPLFARPRRSTSVRAGMPQPSLVQRRAAGRARVTGHSGGVRMREG